MQKKKTVSVIGATGAVGREIVRLLIQRNFPFNTLNLYGSSHSVGKQIQGLPVLPLETLEGTDIAFFAAGAEVSKEWIPKTKCICIDSSSAFRDSLPLIIPEINAHAMTGKQFASPNCAATILLMPLYPLHREFQIKRIVLSTYQAASGGGYRLMSQLEEETRVYLTNGKFKTALPYAFNLFPHNSELHSSGYVDEELKIATETRKILEDDSIKISATCIRVPVLRAHSISMNVEFHHPFSLPQIYELLEKTPGVKVFENREQNRFATPFDVTGKDEVFCGRLRLDPSRKNTLELWAVGDQLLKGAALNAVQIAEQQLLKMQSSRQEQNACHI